jgi:hypothetical protein
LVTLDPWYTKKQSESFVVAVELVKKNSRAATVRQFRTNYNTFEIPLRVWESGSVLSKELQEKYAGNYPIADIVLQQYGPERQQRFYDAPYSWKVQLLNP